MRHWWASLCNKQFVGHEDAIQNAPCNQPLMRENADVSLFPSAIARQPNLYCRAIARICMFGRPICTITDWKTNSAVEMIQVQSRMADSYPLLNQASSVLGSDFPNTLQLRKQQNAALNLGHQSFLYG
jgi:hypothetical protein